MATNTGKEYRIGAVNKRMQVCNPKTDLWVKCDTETGKFVAQKSGGTPFKGIAQEKDGRRK